MSCEQDTLNMTLSTDVMNSAVQSFTLSKRFTQVAVRATILNILYQRMVLHQKDLKTRKMEGTSFMVFKGNKAKHPLLQQYFEWVKGIRDAIDKNYLKEVFLFLKNPMGEELIETYRISLKYNQEDCKGNHQDRRKLRSAMLELLQVISHLGEKEKLDQNTDVQIELTYFPVTPFDYEPPGFFPSLDGYCMMIPQCKIHLGTVNTGFHKLNCYKSADKNEEKRDNGVILQEVQEEEQPNQPGENEEVTIITIKDDVPEAQVEKPPSPKVVPQNVMPEKINISGITVSDIMENVMSDMSGSVEITEDFPVSCVCQVGFALNVDQVTCPKCMVVYHAPCLGYYDKEHAQRSMFTCYKCGDRDYQMQQMRSVDQRELLAKMRLTLFFTEKAGKFPVETMNILSEQHRDIIIQKLQDFNIFKEKKGKINMPALRKNIEKFFWQEDSQTL